MGSNPTNFTTPPGNESPSSFTSMFLGQTDRSVVLKIFTFNYVNLNIQAIANILEKKYSSVPFQLYEQQFPFGIDYLVSPDQVLLLQQQQQQQQQQQHTTSQSSTNDMPKWKCIYSNCSKEYSRSDDFWSRHIFTEHFGYGEIVYECSIDPKHKDVKRTTCRRETVKKHFEKCWERCKHQHHEAYAHMIEPPEHLCSVLIHDVEEYRCRFEGCCYETSTENELRTHVFDQHDGVNNGKLSYTCPRCGSHMESTRNDCFQNHERVCRKKKRAWDRLT